jgi:hypothetical protein
MLLCCRTVLVACALVGLVSANKFKNRVTMRLSSEEERSLSKARATWDHIHHGKPHPSFLEAMENTKESGLRASFKSSMTTRSPRLGARIPQAKVDMSKGPGTFFTQLDNSEHYPLKFRQACVQLNIPVPVLPGMTVDLGLGFILTWGKTCKDGKPCFMQIDADLGIGVTADLGVVHGTVYINGHLDISSTEIPSCKDDSGSKNEKDETAAAKKSLDGLSSSKEEKCGHFYMLRRWIRHYIGTYFYKSEHAQEAMFQQLLDDKGGIEAEKSQADEQKYVTNLLRSIQADSKNVPMISFFPTANPLYRMGQVLSTKVQDVFLPFLATVDFTKTVIKPFMTNRKEVLKAFHNGQLPTDKNFPKARFANFAGKDMSNGKHLVENLPKLVKANEKDRSKLLDIFNWAARYVADSLATQMIMEKSDAKPAAVFDYTGKEGKVPSTIDSCASLPISVFDKFPENQKVPGASPKRLVGEQYGTILKAGTGFQFRATPRMYCTMGKAISKIPESGKGVTWNSDGRKQLFRKGDCELDNKMSKCKKPDCSDVKGCEVCKDVEGSDGDKCKKPPADRLITLKPMNVNKCRWMPEGSFPNIYAMPLWTSNVFPALHSELMKLGAEMAGCDVGAPPPVLAKPPRTGAIANGKSCSPGVEGDALCKSGYCKPPMTWGKGECKDPPGGMKIKDGGDCARDWQCLSGDCKKNTIVSDKCDKTVNKGPNTCVATLNKLFSMFTDKARGPKLIQSMSASFNSVFGVMPKAQADNVCKGFAPASATLAKATGKCDTKTAFSLINSGGKTGKAFQFIADYAVALDKWASDNAKQAEAALKKLDAADAGTVNWSANIAVGTTFGFGGAGGGVGFCTPDTNYIQTLTPVVGYESSFGPKVRAKEQGAGSLGFSVLGHPIPQVGIGITGTRNHATQSWNYEVELRIYVTKAGVSGGGGDPLTGSLDGGLIQSLTPVLSPLLTIIIELFFAADGDFSTAFAKMKDTFKEIVTNPKKLLGAFLAAGATAAAAAMAASLLKALSPVAATAYTILTVKATHEDGDTAFSAEFQSLKTIEFTIGKSPGPVFKPMIGFGTTFDAGVMLNKVFSPKATDKGKAISFKDACKDPKKAASPDCDEPDRRSKLCKMCGELVASTRPKLADEKKMQDQYAGNKQLCTTGVEPSHPKGRGKKTWWCSGSKDALIYSPSPASGVKDACTSAKLGKDGHEVSTDQCEMVRMDWKTFLGANTNSGVFGSVFGDDQGSSKKGFVRTEKEKKLYQQAMITCGSAGKVSNDPDCFDSAICEMGGVACFPAEM